MNIYDKIYLLSKSLDSGDSMNVEISTLVTEDQYKKNLNRTTKMLSGAISWAILNGLMQISPKSGNAVIKQTNLVRSSDIRNMTKIDRCQMARLKHRIGVSSEFRDPTGIEYYKPEIARKILQASVIE